jgi:hypothetical protein
VRAGLQLVKPLSAYRDRRTHEFAYDDEGFTTLGTTLTANASANTKATSYTTLSASCPIDADGFYLNIIAGTAQRDQLLDIAIGGVGSEVNIISNLQFCNGSASITVADVYIPLPVRAGTRVSARTQASTGSATLVVGLDFVKSRHALSFKRATTYGANTADSGGTSVDAGAVINTFGGWTEISSAITNPMKYAIVCLGVGANYGRTAAVGVAEIGRGPNPNEVTVAGGLGQLQGTADDVYQPCTFGRLAEIERGTRLVARARCSLTDAADRLMDVVVIGFD